MDKQEEKLFGLLDHKDYLQLNDEERSFVDQMIGEAMYSKRRKIIQSASEAFEKENATPPLPLVDSSNNRTGLKKEIPLYYAILGVAASFLVMIFLTPLMYNTKVVKEEVQVVQYDTVEVVQKVYDTIVQEKKVPVYVEKKSKNIGYEFVKCQRKEERLLETGTISLPPVNIQDLDNRGTSLANDPTAQLIPEVEVFNMSN